MKKIKERIIKKDMKIEQKKGGRWKIMKENPYYHS